MNDISWIIFDAKCRRLIKNSINKAFGFVFTKLCGQVLGILIFFQSKTYIMSIIYKQLRSIGSQFTGECSNLEPKFAIIFVKIKY